MPKRDDLESILVIGSGPIVIGQACEFDYSGTQACRVLKAEGIRVILVNSNPATIMTDPEFADATYIEPITSEFLEKIIIKERPKALLPTLGGQTALNAALALEDMGILEKYGVELIGATSTTIRRGEDRDTFKEIVNRVGGESALSTICRSEFDLLKAADQLGYPLVIRPSFTMGGLGSGIAYNKDDLLRLGLAGITYSPIHEVLLEESIIGWKEFELELMRDKNDNVVIVCSIENFDPMGVHTGDSITVAPALTLTDVEYQRMRDLAIDIIREVGVETGGCNIQFAVNPKNGRLIVIEMNPRVSRSSALASKATGFPIAKIATKLAIGYTLDEIPNDITRATPASFEPVLDYVVVKVPRFAFEKFPTADQTLTTTMKSVGEAMAIGRNFQEALQKALRSLDTANSEFDWTSTPQTNVQHLKDEMSRPTQNRIHQIQQAILSGMSIKEIHEITKVDPWFLNQIAHLADIAKSITSEVLQNSHSLKYCKKNGFSDYQISNILSITEEKVREARHALGVRPVFKTVDTCAAEFEAVTPYYYSSYDEVSEVQPRNQPAVIILGSGPNRIGQGVEFDYSCVQSSFALQSQNIDTIMINCNPETVSTDYDTSSRLYFEPLTFEDVSEILYAEKIAGPVLGVITQMGGQTPLKLSKPLELSGESILGTSSESISLAEDRGKFASLLIANGLNAPNFGVAHSKDQALELTKQIGYPVLMRPSFVLGGRGMEIIYDDNSVIKYFEQGTEISSDSPILIDRFLEDALEIDVDAIFDGREIFVGGIMEHIEEAGIHSGDSACALPPITLSATVEERIRIATKTLAHGIGVKGLINIQFALLNDILYVLEANPRASRTVPFVSKATGVNLAKAAALISIGLSISQIRNLGFIPNENQDHALSRGIAVKEAVLPWNRFRKIDGSNIDVLLGPEMKSTGEVMGLDSTFGASYAKSQIAAFGPLPLSGSIFLSFADRDKRSMVLGVSKLVDMGFTIYATSGTRAVLNKFGIPSRMVRKESEVGEGPSIVGLINAGEIDLVVNTPFGIGPRRDGWKIRNAATMNGIPCITTVQGFSAAIQGIDSRRRSGSVVQSLQDWLRKGSIQA